MHNTHKRGTPSSHAAMRSIRVPLVVKMNMSVGSSAMGVRMDMQMEQSHSQEDDHQRDCELQNVGDSFWNHESKAHDEEASDENGCGVSGTPEGADPRRLPHGAALANDCGNGREMVRFRRMFEAEYKSEAQGCEHR